MTFRNGTLRTTLLVAASLATVALTAPAAGAYTVTDSATPLGIVSNATKPDCASPYAPFGQSDLIATIDRIDPSDDSSDSEQLPGMDQLAFAGLGFDVIPTATLCTPDSIEIPGAFGGTTATRLQHGRVGRGWREIGGDLAQPAPLLPGDRLIVPDAGDTAQLKVGVAPSPGAPAATVPFTDLSPGPSTVTVVRDQRGVVATLTRGDGSTVDAVANVPVVPSLNPSVSGSRLKWNIVTHQMPGTVVFASELFDEAGGIGVSGNDGRTVTTIKRTRRGRRSTDLLLVALNRSAMTYDIAGCTVRLDRARRPVAIGCEGLGLGDLFSLATHASHAAAAPAQAAPATTALRTVRAGAARAQAKSPLLVQPVTRSPAMVRLNAGNLVPLAADVNGDGQTDFWTEDSADEGFSFTTLAETAGTVFISGPSGLQPHSVEFARGLNLDSDGFDSEISAIDDITGDGIGELVVDLGERHAVIPGNAVWSTNGAAIIAPDPAALDASDYLLLPSSSSPGAPYASLDDATGDGRRELAATDDFGAWQSISSSLLRPGLPLRLASVARAVPAPSVVYRTELAEETAPRFDPRGRIIAGQFIGLTWPTLATKASPVGKVTIRVSDALGRDVVPPATATVPGNALLLDHDRRSGDSLLLAATTACAADSERIRRRGCKQTVVRVRADGSIRQTLKLSRDSAQTTAPQTARFLADGPDADGDDEIVLTEDGVSASIVDSTLTGTVAASQFSRARAPLLRRANFWEGLRFYPVVAPDGTRRVYALVGSSPRYRDSADEGLPIELSWK